MEGATSDQPRRSPPLVLIFPYPSQGHINPMIQFAKRLAIHGIEARYVTMPYVLRSLLSAADHLSIPVELISDGFDESGFAQCGDVRTYLEQFKSVGSRTLAELIVRLAGSGRPVSWIIYDAFLPWILDVAKPLGVQGASFSTQLGTVIVAYYLHHHKKLALPPSPEAGRSTVVPLPGLPVAKLEGMPSIITSPDSTPAYADLLLNQFSTTADVMLLNSVQELEDGVLHAMADSLPFKPVGPMLPLAYVDPNASSDKAHDMNLRKPAASGDLLEWLDAKPPRSVVYIAFGSSGKLSGAQAAEMAAALQAADKHFIWVVRDAGSVEDLEAGTKGRIVTWCRQPEVLGHAATGCFVTHSGWNSTLEALCLGVPMVCMPQWSDQPTNAMYVEEVWGVGVKARADDEKGIVGRTEIERCVREVMAEGGEKGRNIWSNVEKWKQGIKKATQQGGSSDRNTREFVAKVFGKN